MPRLFRRAVAGLLVGPFFALASPLSPVHAHTGEGPDGHGFVHSHFDPHHLTEHSTEGPEVSPDEHVVWLETVAVDVLPFHLDAPAAVLADIDREITVARSWSVVTFDDGAPPHGPPRAAPSLRAPPVLPV